MPALFERLTVTPGVAGTYAALALGVLMLVVALLPARSVMQELSPGRLRAGWGVLIGLILLFIAGYLAQIVLSLQHPAGPDLLVTAVFLAGAWFVLLVCRLARTTVRHVTRLGVLEVENLTDELMGVGNRRFFERRFHEEVVRAKRYGNPLSVLLFDIDHFRQINETWGHEGGDRALRAIGALLREAIRTPDLVARYGGEEIAVLLPYTGLPGALLLAERLREAIASNDVRVNDDRADPRALRVTASAGVATLTADVEEFPELMRRADAALYRAKHEGRNRVIADARDGPPTDGSPARRR